jgi:dihydropteroate synthase
MGVLNVTPDSFSDGGAHFDPARAIERAWRIADEGADLIDIGGESTRPGAEPVSAESEASRVMPIITGLGSRYPIPISIDTSKGAVARQALVAGADLVNDVSGLSDPSLAAAAAEFGAPLVVSHIRGTPRTMQADPRYDDPMAEVAAELLAAVSIALREGVASEAILLDPGVGFGKTFENNLEIIRRLPEIAGLGHPVLVGVSRKSFIGQILDRPAGERIEGSLAAGAAALAGGAAMLRVHDVAETRRFFAVWDALFHRGPSEKGGA